MWLHVQTEGEVQTMTKRVRQLEEDFEQTETRLHAANEKFAEASKAADESERSKRYYTLSHKNDTALDCYKFDA